MPMSKKEKVLQDKLSLLLKANNLYLKKIKQLENDIFKWKSIGNSLPNCIYIKDTQGKYLWVNQNSINQIKKVHAIHIDIVGKKDSDIFPKEAAENYLKNDQVILQTQKGCIHEERVLLPNGKEMINLSFKEPFYNKSGNLAGILGYTINITELKKTQAELQLALQKAEIANQAKTEFLENMRHDIRTPLNGIVGCAQLIQMQANDPKKVIEYAKDLVQSSDALLAFLNKILESIQAASGEIPLLKKKFNLYQLLNQIIQLNKTEAHIKHLKLQLDYDKTIPGYLLGDPIRVQRIILELVTNALKFTGKGEVKITARLEKNKTKRGQVIVSLSVSDTGIGIPLAQQNEVYTRFKRLTPSYQGIYPGTGLGLAISKQFIDDLDGEIHLDSQPKKGSTFTCLISFQESLLEIDNEGKIEEISASLDKKCEKIAAEQETILKTGSRVLVVEDNPISIKVAQGILSGLNCQVDIVEDGKTAITVIEKNRYDLILMDIGLPDGDGCKVTRCIRLKQRQRNPSVAIVGLTAHITDEKKLQCLKNGMNAIYTKPLTRVKAEEILNFAVISSFGRKS